MNEKNIFDILENAEYNSMERLIEKCPEISDKQLDRILAKSEKKYKVLKKGTERTKKDNHIKMTENSTAEGVERSKRPAWLTPLSTAASLLLIAGIAVASTMLIRNNIKIVNNGGGKTPAVTVTTISTTGTTHVSTDKNGSTITTTQTTATATTETVSENTSEQAVEIVTEIVAENEFIIPFIGKWKYQVSSGNYTVDKCPMDKAVIDIREDATYTYTSADGTVSTGKVRKGSGGYIGGQNVQTIDLVKGSETELSGYYSDDDYSVIKVGNGGLARIIRADGDTGIQIPDWKATYKATLEENMRNANYGDSNAWDLADIDSDGVPELLISSNDDENGIVTVYYYENGYVNPITDTYVLKQFGVNGELLYCPEEKLIGWVNEKYKAHYTYKFENHENSSVQALFDASEYETYSLNYEPISKEEYDRALAVFNSKNWKTAGRRYSFSDLSPLN